MGGRITNSPPSPSCRRCTRLAETPDLDYASNLKRIKIATIKLQNMHGHSRALYS